MVSSIIRNENNVWELIIYSFVYRHQDWEDEEQNEDFLEQLRAEIKK